MLMRGSLGLQTAAQRHPCGLPDHLSHLPSELLCSTWTWKALQPRAQKFRKVLGTILLLWHRKMIPPTAALQLPAFRLSRPPAKLDRSLVRAGLNFRDPLLSPVCVRSTAGTAVLLSCFMVLWLVCQIFLIS